MTPVTMPGQSLGQSAVRARTGCNALQHRLAVRQWHKHFNCTRTGCFPADSGDSRRSRGACTRKSRDLPILSPHGHTDPQWFASECAVHQCDRVAARARSLPVSHAVQPGHSISTRSACASRRGSFARRSARCVAHCSQRTSICFAARLCAVAELCVRESVRLRRCALEADDRRSLLRCHRREARAAPSSGRARCSSASTSRCWRRPNRRSTRSMHHRAIREQRLARSRHHGLSTRCRDRSRARGISPRRSSTSASSRAKTCYSWHGYLRGASQAPRGVRASRRDLDRSRPSDGATADLSTREAERLFARVSTGNFIASRRRAVSRGDAGRDGDA